MAGKANATNAPTKGTKSVPSTVSAEATTPKATFGGMDVDAVAQQLGLPAGTDLTALESYAVGEKGLSPREFTAMLKDPNGATALISRLGPSTETAAAMDFVSPEINPTTGGRPGDAARAAKAQMTRELDGDAKLPDTFKEYIRGMAAGQQMTGVDVGPQLDVSAAGVRPTQPAPRPKAERTAKADKPAGAAAAVEQAAGGDGAGPPADTTATTGDAGDGPKPADDKGGKKGIVERVRGAKRPDGGYLYALQKGGAKMLMNELPGIATATLGGGALYSIGDYMVGGPLSQALGLRPNTEDQREQDAARAVLRQMEPGQYGNQDAALWGIGGPQPNNPAGSMASDAATLPASQQQVPQLVPNRYEQVLRQMGTLGGRQQ